MIGSGGPTTISSLTVDYDITLDSYGSPYIITGGISVTKGATLTIEQGVRVELANSVEIYVQGTLKATGVKFTSYIPGSM